MAVTLSPSIDRRLDANKDYYFDLKSRRYRYRDSRRFAPKIAILNLTRSYLHRQQQALKDLGTAYTKGTIDASQLQQDAGKVLKEIHLAQATIAAHGTENLMPQHFLIVARRLKTQYYSGKDPITGDRYGLRYLFRELESGRVTPAQLVNRLGMFADSGKGTYWEIGTEISRAEGKTQALRVLGHAEHCPECPQYAARGWVNISDIILPTERCTCRNRCRCRLEYR